jgi:diaminopropionate ammonia-lyase
VSATMFVPAVMLPHTASLIEGEDEEVVWVDGDYDATVRHAADYADEAPGRALVQDTAWPGYERVPAWIVEGYQTLLAEVDAQLERHLGTMPDLVVVPVGVGSLAEAVVRHYRSPIAPRPAVMSVEPVTAACVLESLTVGHPVTVQTAPTVMAGLNCGTVSASAWPVLQAGLDAAVAVTDEQARAAVVSLDGAGVSARRPWPRRAPRSVPTPDPTAVRCSASARTRSSF